LETRESANWVKLTRKNHKQQTGGMDGWLSTRYNKFVKVLDK